MDFFNDHAVAFALICAGVGIGFGVYFTMWLLRQPAGSERMQEISRAVQEGAAAYLRRQYTTIAAVAVVPFLLIGFYPELGWGTAIGFAIGAILSAAAGFIGMNVAVRSNVRTAEAAKSGLRPALDVAFRAGSVTGLLVVGLGLLGVAGYYGFLTDRSRQQPGVGHRRPHRPGLRRLPHLGLRPSRRRHLHQGRRRRRRPRRQDRGGHSRGRPAQPGRDRRQRRRQRRRLRGHGCRPLRDVCRDRGRGDAARHGVPRREPAALSARDRRCLDPRLRDRRLLRQGRPQRLDHQRALQERRRRDRAVRRSASSPSRSRSTRARSASGSSTARRLSASSSRSRSSRSPSTTPARAGTRSSRSRRHHRRGTRRTSSRGSPWACAPPPRRCS